jgi:hypothetical protein
MGFPGISVEVEIVHSIACSMEVHSQDAHYGKADSGAEKAGTAGRTRGKIPPGTTPKLQTTVGLPELFQHPVTTEFLTAVILPEFLDLVVVLKVAMVAIFPNVTGVGVEKRVVTAAI